MDGKLEFLRQVVGDLGPLLRGALVFLGVVIALAVTQRILRRSSSALGGNRFRNQLIILAGSFVGLLIIILGLPLDSTTKGQLLGLVGLMFSATIALSSSTILGNAMAGIMLKAVRNFRSGDFIRTAEHFGRVTERGLFHTEIQTADRDLTTLPNMYLANTPVTVIRSSGTIIDARVSLGYDIHHGRIEAQLLAAARQVGLGDPFVQVLELGDFAVTYRLAGLLAETKQILAYKSRLRKAVLDALHTDGIEIVSPHFENARRFVPADRFIPADEVCRPVAARDGAPVEVVFDKAEEAETLDTLRADMVALEARLDTTQKALKSESDAHGKEKLAARIQSIQARVTALQAEIEEAEAKEKTD